MLKAKYEMRVNEMAIAGKSGSGKTTTTHILQGALKDLEIVSLDSNPITKAIYPIIIG